MFLFVVAGSESFRHQSRHGKLGPRITLESNGIGPAERAAMGRAGRAKMEREFDREIVIDKYIREVEQ